MIDSVVDTECKSLNWFDFVDVSRLYQSTEPYAILRTLKEGIQDLFLAADNWTDECAFLFFETEKLWLNLTIQSVKSGDQVIGTKNRRFDYSTVGMNLKHIHIHPRAQELIFKQRLWDALPPEKQNQLGRQIVNRVVRSIMVLSKEYDSSYAWMKQTSSNVHPDTAVAIEVMDHLMKSIEIKFYKRK